MAHVKIENLTSEIMKGMKEYSELVTQDLKETVKKTASNLKKDIAESAPKNTGDYSKSWRVKKTKETSNTLEMTVYSKDRYQLTHLLEYGHAKRRGGRVPARPHIKAAEENAIKTMEADIKRRLGG